MALDRSALRLKHDRPVHPIHGRLAENTGEHQRGEDADERLAQWRLDEPPNEKGAQEHRGKHHEERAVSFSGVVNLLMLAGPLYLLQVYDRVIPSHSLSTLLGLSAIVLVVYLAQGYFDALRMRMLTRIASLFDAALQEPILLALVTLPIRGARPALVQQPMRDLQQVRLFLSGVGPTAFLDLPWIPFFIVMLFLFHPVIGVTALLGATAIVAMAFLAERFSAHASKLAMEASAQRQMFADATRRNAEVIQALGMRRRVSATWRHANDKFLEENLRAMDLHAALGTFARVMRYALQSAMLAVAAYLVVIEQASGGIMIASSIMMGRALAPIEVVLGTWQQLVAARHSVGRLRVVLKALSPVAGPAVTLARPERELIVSSLAVAAPGSESSILSNVSFSIAAGSGLAVLGASASGKSCLAKVLVGVWPAHRGWCVSTMQLSINGIRTSSERISVICRKRSPCSRGASPKTFRASIPRRLPRPFSKPRRPRERTK
jgi:ATP-binding cassette subfamily C protein PrsD